jgi:hypothetical protein
MGRVSESEGGVIQAGPCNGPVVGSLWEGHMAVAQVSLSKLRGVPGRLREGERLVRGGLIVAKQAPGRVWERMDGERMPGASLGVGGWGNPCWLRDWPCRVLTGGIIAGAWTSAFKTHAGGGHFAPTRGLVHCGVRTWRRLCAVNSRAYLEGIGRRNEFGSRRLRRTVPAL